MPLRQIQAIDETNELYSNFINSIESTFTRRAFSGYLRRYMEYHSFTAYEQLISERKIVQSQVIDFINAQKSKGLTADSIGNYLTAIKHFYVYNDVTDINWLKVKKFLGERTKLLKLHQLPSCHMLGNWVLNCQHHLVP
jgi:site-specific recombinase XerD